MPKGPSATISPTFEIIDGRFILDELKVGIRTFFAPLRQLIAIVAEGDDRSDPGSGSASNEPGRHNATENASNLTGEGKGPQSASYGELLGQEGVDFNSLKSKFDELSTRLNLMAERVSLSSSEYSKTLRGIENYPFPMLSTLLVADLNQQSARLFSEVEAAILSSLSADDISVRNKNLAELNKRISDMLNVSKLQVELTNFTQSGLVPTVSLIRAAQGINSIEGFLPVLLFPFDSGSYGELNAGGLSAPGFPGHSLVASVPSLDKSPVSEATKTSLQRPKPK